ncbi:MAG: acyclic terpene utilization AtuA family protein [Planctomycetota bacterium]
MKRSIRVGNAHAFWGDRLAAARELLALEPDLDYLVMDFLAEVSMSILAGQRERDPAAGFVRDVLTVVADLAAFWSAGGRCRVIVNAGGLDPAGCAAACRRVIEEAGCRAVTIGSLRAGGGPDAFTNLDSGAALDTVRDRLVTANAYLGAGPVVEALAAGADLVITGRVADPSPVVAACRHAFAWRADDHDLTAGATVAGHLLECGTQVTGGISTDWLDVPAPESIGFPVAEIAADGSCVITKAAGSGGRVTTATVKEQLVYEIGDPARYLSPDATVSFLGLEVTEVGPDRVRVAGARGGPPPESLKVSATYRDGFRAAATLTMFGPESATKARRCGAIVLGRLAAAGHRFRDTLVECLGQGDSVPVLPPDLVPTDAWETVLRIAVEADDAAPVEAFTREVMPLVTAGPQGTTGYAGGRPRVHRLLRYWPCLVRADRVIPTMTTLVTADTGPARRPAPAPAPVRAAPATPPPAPPPGPPRRLLDVAFGRSGDKGTGANVGILVRDPADWPWLRSWLTAERVAAWLGPLGVEEVTAYPLPALGGINFVVRGVLRRGLRNDAQGKALAQAVLAMPLDAPPTR